jgi:hypothetical protein
VAAAALAFKVGVAAEVLERPVLRVNPGQRAGVEHLRPANQQYPDESS